MTLTLLLLASLAVLDISNQRSKADHARYYTKLSALKAIDAYFKAWEEKDLDGNLLYDCGTDDTTCRKIAIKAANDYLLTADKEHAVFDSEEARGDEKNYDVGSAGEHYAHNKIQEGVDPKEGLNITFGHWVNCRNDSEKCFEKCSSSSSFACSASASVGGESNPSDEVQELSDSPEQFFMTREEYESEFKRIHGTAQGIGNPNAVYIEGKWLQDNKSYALSGILNGGGRVAPTIKATAMVVPRNVYFLVDISKSGEFDTFSRQAGSNRYAQCYDMKACRKPGMIDPAVRRMLGMEESVAKKNNRRDVADLNPDNYYYSDYVRKVTLGDDDYEGIPERERIIHPTPSKYSLHLTGNGTSWGSIDSDRNSFFIHAYNPKGEGDPRPEPLVTIIKAVHEAIGILKDRRVNGDKAGVIFFTNGLVWPRITKLTSDLETLYEFTDYRGNLDISNGMVLKNDIDPLRGSTKSSDYISYTTEELLNVESGLERAIRYSIFPVPSYADKHNPGRGDTWGYSNIMEALTVALNYINEADCPKDINGKCLKMEQLDPNVSRSIVLFTDGVQNCRLRGEESPIGGYECDQRDIEFYNQGIADIKNLVLEGENSMRKKNIPLHIFQTGEDVAPHTMALTKEHDITSCFTDAECRVSKDCNPDAFVTKNDTDEEAKCAYAYATDDTQYIKDAENNGTPCGEQVPFYNASYDMYHLALETGGVYVPIRRRDDNCDIRCGKNKSCDKFDCSRYAKDQRITTDPYCRSLEKQIQDGMDDAIGVNPYRIVDVE